MRKQLVLVVGMQHSQFENVAYLLTYIECSYGLTTRQGRDLNLKAAKYVIWDDKIFKKAIDGTFLRCVDT